MNKLLYIFIFLCVQNCVFAQFNFQVGYQYSWSPLIQLNDLISEYNSLHPEFSRKLNTLHGFHGIKLGLRQQINSISVVGSWTNEIAKSYSLIEGMNEVQDEYFYKKQRISLGLESAKGIFSLGTTIDLQLLSIKNRITGSEDKTDLLDQSRFGNTIYGQLDFPLSQRMGLLIRLSYQFPWEEYNLEFIQKHFKTSNNSTKEKFNQFGISLIFSNGFQTRY